MELEILRILEKYPHRNKEKTFQPNSGRYETKYLDLSKRFRQRWRKKNRSGNPYGGLKLSDPGKDLNVLIVNKSDHLTLVIYIFNRHILLQIFQIK